jgi:tRNA nucleotidyltransferase (CCA-adding enzyme)
VKELKRELEKRGSTIVFLAFGKVDAVPDVLWGQLYKSQRSLSKLVQLNDFNILRNIPWSDEKTLNMFIFELEQRILPPIKKHFGPPLEKEHECEDGRWVVEIRRKYTDAVALLSDRLRDGGRRAGVAEQISQTLCKEFEIFVNNEIAEVYEKNSEFAKFLAEFLYGKPKWLEPS